MNKIAELAAVVLISGLAAGTTFLLKGPPKRSYFCNPATLKADEICLAQITNTTAMVWVDARHRRDWEKTRMPGALLWNLDAGEDTQAFEANLAARVIETPRVVVYCSDENCGTSREVAKQIRGLGLGAEVSILRGGWRALKDAGRIKDSSPKD